MALTLAAALLALSVVLYVISPILQGQHAPLSGEQDDLEDAQASKKAALRALRDAELDFATGKLDAADYERLRTELSAEALAAVERAGSLEAKVAEPPATELEATAPTEEGGDGRRFADQVEARIAEVRAGLRDGTTCVHCGQVNREGSNFCTSCGRPLVRSMATSTRS